MKRFNKYVQRWAFVLKYYNSLSRARRAKTFVLDSHMNAKAKPYASFKIIHTIVELFSFAISVSHLFDY